MWTDCLILCAIGDSAPYSKSGLRAVQAQLTINKLTHRYLLRVCVFCLDVIYNPTHPPDTNVLGEGNHRTQWVVTLETEKTAIN